MRRFFTALALLAGLGALGVTVAFVLETFRAKGEFAIRPREKPGMKFAVNETLTHGSRAEETRWSADYMDEILAVSGGRPTSLRRAYVSFEMDAQGPPHPTPLSATVLLDDAGARLESSGQPFTSAPTSWPDPFYGVLPERPVHHSDVWAGSNAAAAALAVFLARAPSSDARLETRLEMEHMLDGIACWRLRSGLNARLEDGRTLKAVGDHYYDRKNGVLISIEWLGTLEGEKGEERVHYDRQRRFRK